MEHTIATRGRDLADEAACHRCDGTQAAPVEPTGRVPVNSMAPQPAKPECAPCPARRLFTQSSDLSLYDFIQLARLRDFSGLTEDELLEAQNNVAAEAAAWLKQIDEAIASPLCGEPSTELRAAVAWAYQAIGALWPNQEALDNLSAVLQGKPLPREWPVVTPLCGEQQNAELRAELEESGRDGRYTMLVAKGLQDDIAQLRARVSELEQALRRISRIMSGRAPADRGALLLYGDVDEIERLANLADQRQPTPLPTPASAEKQSKNACPGGRSCTCCHPGCDCGCRDECPVLRN
jgi:hypothetical protein